MEISTEIRGAEEVIRALTILQKRTPGAIQIAARRLLMRVKSAAIQNVSNDVLQVRTATLRRWISAQEVIEESPTTWSWGLPSEFGPSNYGAKLETGGDILPKNGKLLRVPLAAAKTANGVDRYAGQSFRNTGLPEGLKVIARPGRTPLIVKILEKKRNARWELWYALVPKVTIKPHPWFSSAVRAATETEPPNKVLADTLQELVDGL